MKNLNRRTRVVIGLLAGAAIAYVDNVAFGGETSPVVIVLLLLAATALVAAIWGRYGWLTAATLWLCVPLAHALKHLFGLPDTLHPNTYASIMLLAGFTFLVAALGTATGMLIHAATTARR